MSAQDHISEPIQVGDNATDVKHITRDDVLKFSEVTGDRNPVHLDEEYAKNTMFKRPIAHGMLSAGLVSKVLGTQLPGYGSIYLSQTFNFKRPVYIGDTVTTIVTVKEIKEEKNIFILETLCKNQDGKILLDGEAMIMLPK